MNTCGNFPEPHEVLRFVMVGQHYQYTALPFDLSSAPIIFTKCMALMTAVPQIRGIHVFLYLDNWLERGKLRTSPFVCPVYITPFQSSGSDFEQGKVDINTSLKNQVRVPN